MDPTVVLLWESSPKKASKKQGGFEKKTWKAASNDFSQLKGSPKIHGFPLILGKDTVDGSEIRLTS